MPQAIGIREQSVAATVHAVVRAARDVLSDPEPGTWSMEAVALAAGVTRATVYNHFRSRTDLIEAVLDTVVARDRMDRLVEVSADADPVVALRQAVARTCRFWHAERPLLRRLFATAYADASVEALLRRREGWRREQLAVLLGRVGGVPSRAAARTRADVLLALTSFPTYDRLAGSTDGPGRTATTLNQLVSALLAGAHA
ncbi:MAG: TetR/AcrR family transcriptional regulator [Actinomycetota bacterium]